MLKKAKGITYGNSALIIKPFKLCFFAKFFYYEIKKISSLKRLNFTQFKAINDMILTNE